MNKIKVCIKCKYYKNKMYNNNNEYKYLKGYCSIRKGFVVAKIKEAEKCKYYEVD